MLLKLITHPRAFLLALALALPAQATTIQRFSFEELADYADFIFQGSVTNVRSDQAADGLVYTWVRFQVDEVVKGVSPGAQLELRFLGGETADKKVSVADMDIPEEGETGIYFVESLDANLVNPLLGWSQGHFLIARDAAGELVITDAKGRDPAGLLEQPSALENKLGNLKQGRSALESKAPASATTPEDFKQAIRAALESSSQ